MLPDHDALQSILAAGIQAPSAENRHELRFVVAPDHVRLCATTADTWGPQPHRRLLALLALGAVVENMALRSAALGWRLQALAATPAAAREQSVADVGAAVVAELRWSPQPAQPDRLEVAIATRSTNRRFYQRRVVDTATRSQLAAAAADVAGAGLRWLDDSTSRRLALRAIRLAETERFRRRELHRELYGSIRFHTGWRAPTDEWLAPAALEVEWPMQAPFALFRHWPVMRAAHAVGVHHAFGLRAGLLPAALAPHIGLIVMQPERPDATAANQSDRLPSWLSAGRALQRVWLAAAADGIAFQPLAAATVLLHQPSGPGWASDRTQSALHDVFAQLGAGTAGAPDPCMLFRIGHAPPSRVRAGRRPVADYIA